MHDVAWRSMWICVRSKDAQKQLARTSLIIRVLKVLGDWFTAQIEHGFCTGIDTETTHKTTDGRLSLGALAEETCSQLLDEVEQPC